MDALMAHQDPVDRVVAGLLRPLVDQAEVLSAFGVKKPAASQQLSLLSWSVFESTLRKTMTYVPNCRTPVLSLQKIAVTSS